MNYTYRDAKNLLHGIRTVEIAEGDVRLQVLREGLVMFEIGKRGITRNASYPLDADTVDGHHHDQGNRRVIYTLHSEQEATGSLTEKELTNAAGGYSSPQTKVLVPFYKVAGDALLRLRCEVETNAGTGGENHTVSLRYDGGTLESTIYTTDKAWEALTLTQDISAEADDSSHYAEVLLECDAGTVTIRRAIITVESQ